MVAAVALVGLMAQYLKPVELLQQVAALVETHQ
jgi:hypothetical protein